MSTIKVLIELDEEEYEATKHIPELYRGNLIKAIANGIPLPKGHGDLISREALKQMMPAPIEDEYKRVHQIIDNAPAVKFSLLPADESKDEAYMRGYEKGLAIGLLKTRPKGDWIDTGDMEEYWAEEYQCSICGAKDHWHNYCPSCGADMRKGDAE